MVKNNYQVHGFKTMHVQYQCFDQAWATTWVSNNWAKIQLKHLYNILLIKPSLATCAKKLIQAIVSNMDERRKLKMDIGNLHRKMSVSNRYKCITWKFLEQDYMLINMKLFDVEGT
jgi:hypothetical protein